MALFFPRFQITERGFLIGVGPETVQALLQQARIPTEYLRTSATGGQVDAAENAGIDDAKFRKA
ncbi:MAG TPA: hypothetical protein VKB79_07585 [Bryobacteraceae bacterium]|nr:hypothetical protein [Bryobacteraceae bacterium]